MRAIVLGLLLSCCVGAGQAHAVGEEPSAGADYPIPLVERPLVLPPRMVQPALGIDVANSDNRSLAATGETLAFGADVGIVRRLQAGAYFAFPLNPVANLGTFLANVQLGLHRDVSVRLDVGMTRLSSSIDGSRKDFLTLALGLPWRVRLRRRLALVSGSTSALGFGPTLHVGKNTPISFAGYQGNAVTNHALVTLLGDGNGQLLTAQVPLGLLVQPHRVLALTASVAYRAIIALPNGTVLHTLPVDGDVVATVVPRLDAGFHVELVGFLGGTYAYNGASTTHASWFADTRIFSLFVRGRI
jgi:hypothetical protein